jgi:hypothetical protein
VVHAVCVRDATFGASQSGFGVELRTGSGGGLAMLNWQVVTKSLASFTAITFVLCVGYGLLAPPAFHPSWLLEAMLPGFNG